MQPNVGMNNTFINNYPAEFDIILTALKEDLLFPWSDLTSAVLFQAETLGQAYLISKHPEMVTICGLSLIQEIFTHIDPHCDITLYYQDGDQIPTGETIAKVTGSAKSLLMAERTLLNFLRHLSGIATLTAKFTSQVNHTALKILDTRKTTPGLRHLEKYAVACGGGVNHRMGLYDALMIKDTHVDILGGMAEVLMQLPLLKEYPVIVEIRHPEELDLILTLGKGKISRVLLDNMSTGELKFCADRCNGILETEASGNINLQTIQAIAETGVDYASVGMLTHSAGHVDLSMKTRKVTA